MDSGVLGGTNSYFKNMGSGGFQVQGKLDGSGFRWGSGYRWEHRKWVKIGSIFQLGTRKVGSWFKVGTQKVGFSWFREN